MTAPAGPGSTRFAPESFAPIAVATRSSLDESLHYGAGLVIDGVGAIEQSIGDHALVVYPRSALKPMQADAMLRLGVTLTTEQLALACASHSGEEMHLRVALDTLATNGLVESDLRNTSTRPFGAAARAAARAAGRGPSSLQQNCSGKHAAMLATCAANGWPTENYLDVDHPLQVAILHHVGRLAGEEVKHVGVDGCGAPTHAFSLHGLARAFAHLATDSAVGDAMRAHPELVGGTGRDITIWMQAVPGLIAKEGADGVMAAALPNGRAVAYKIADGSDSARQAVMVEAMRHLGVGRDVVDALAVDLVVPVLGHGLAVGELRALNWAGE
jgi:L-asparaginase II